eukprot:CAMPEP_0179170324 /NCGR_PEP_ID=MMETSP0796-20121207/83897_1 /TAXON_ID=73915 /ORGANISM="Pyrodinium bahamense, Strain pbaha01" /LENGTH=75 /DNA_ID=CAMNT_0020873283 /DNA_START=50 /DNA_END=274 /DNA_ORIENTATION=-
MTKRDAHVQQGLRTDVWKTRLRSSAAPRHLLDGPTGVAAGPSADQLVRWPPSCNVAAPATPRAGYAAAVPAWLRK